MPLAAGQRLGSYEVLAPLGAGGMGEVYRASDTRLQREVALKVLPEVFAHDPERMARFSREAHVLAALNHPNIAAIHGLEETDTTRALVMELVEGPTLAERIAQGPVPIDEALPIARQIADALEYAHEHGIIHRDLKPANIKLRPDGTVKVLDFGLARAMDAQPVSSSPEASPTLTLAATRAGVILGTAAYMSPEQARGKPVDRRADIWAFGVVLYEMLAGRQIFGGETVSDSLAAVITREPDWERLPGDTPGDVRRLLERCLRKDPRRRLQSIGDARIAVEEVLGGAAEPALPASVPPARRTRWWGALAAAVVATALVTALVALGLRPRATEAPLRKFDIPAPNLSAGIPTPPAISPDGRRILYVAGGSLWVRELDRLEPRQLVAGGSPEFPMWSPGSDQVAYVADSKLWKVAVTGGTPTMIASAGFNRGGTTPGGVWTGEGKIVFAPAASGSGLLAVSDQGGDFAPFMERDEKTESDFHKPSPLPGNKGLLFVVDRNGGGPDTIGVLSGRSRKTILRLEGEELDSPVYSPTGHILYRRDSGNAGIWAVSFSLDKLEAAGQPFLAVPGGRWPSVSTDGTLLYTSAQMSRMQLVLTDRTGKVERTLGQPQLFIRHPAFAPDGNRVAVVEDEGVFIHDIRRQTRTRLTFDNATYFNPGWSPAADRVFFVGRKGGLAPQISSAAADGSGAAQTVVPGWMPNVSSDGKWLVYSEVVPHEGSDLFYLPIPGGGDPISFLQAPGDQLGPALSPNGKYLAYWSDESGKVEIYLKPFPRGEGKWQVSSSGGRAPRWNKSGDRLFYVNGSDLIEVEVATAPAVQLGTPRVLFSGTAARLRLDRLYDASPDGRTFAAVQEFSGDAEKVSTLSLVENWSVEFPKQ